MAEDLPPSPTPLTPPHCEEEAVTWLRLLRSRRVGPATFYRLMAEHGSAAAALDALPEVARAAGVENYEPWSENAALAEMRAARLAGARLLTRGDPAYPPLLALLPDAPPLLWTLGDRGLLARPMVALVGARNASSLGTRMARRLAEGLAQAGYVVVSGLARGIDAAAHIAASDSGTLAVMAGGVDVVYPAENAALAQEIAERGLRLSEQPPGLQPQARHFPQRNRIISGLARAVVVVEAAARSGSLITARNALDQGRDVLAVPGHPFDARGSGCNMLIRDGATLVRHADDVIEALGTATAAQTARPQADGPAARPTPRPSGSGDARAGAPRPDPPSRGAEDTRRLHGEILARLGPTPLAEDQLIRDLQLPASRVTPELVSLELEGKLHRQPGGLLCRAV